MKAKHIGILFAALGLSAGPAPADVPASINYQGKLMNGTNLFNGTVPITFKLFDAPTGGAPHLTDSNDVIVVDGLYATRIGDAVTQGSLDDALRQSEVWIEVTLGAQVMAPRERLVSVGYALYAAKLPDNAVDENMLADNAVQSRHLAPGQIVGDHIQGGVVSNVHLAEGSITSNRIDWTTMPPVPLPFHLDSYVENGTFVVAPSAGGDDAIALGYGAVADGVCANVSGGRENVVLADFSAIGGGENNFIEAPSSHAFIGGGLANRIVQERLPPAPDIPTFGVIAGGQSNSIEEVSHWSAIVGGRINRIASSFASFVGGGHDNFMTNSSYSVISGGLRNSITNSSYCAISGGSDCTIGESSHYSIIAGGQSQRMGVSNYNTAILGGRDHQVHDNCRYSTIAGGRDHTIEPAATHVTIVGGRSHGIGAGSTHISIVGGAHNRTETNVHYSSIGGGLQNWIDHSSGYCTIAGGRSNRMRNALFYSTIAGGYENEIGENSISCTIAGGERNRIETTAHYSTVGGGTDNRIGTLAAYATILGGFSNSVSPSAQYAMLVGGRDNVAGGSYSLAAGRSAKAAHDGSFIWADGTGAEIASTADHQTTFRSSGGFRIFTDASAALGAELAPNATAWSALSDRNAKENFGAIDTQAILNGVATLPLTAWNYKADPDKRRYIGPVAQDFHAAFALGNETSINALDADGVALAAIQALKRENDDLKVRIERLEAALGALGVSP